MRVQSRRHRDSLCVPQVKKKNILLSSVYLSYELPSFPDALSLSLVGCCEVFVEMRSLLDANGFVAVQKSKAQKYE